MPLSIAAFNVSVPGIQSRRAAALRYVDVFYFFSSKYIVDIDILFRISIGKCD